MKTCICCGAKANADAQTCPNCGEGSWSDSRIVVLQRKDEPPKEKPIVIGPRMHEEANRTVPESFSQPAVIASDPDTAIDVPIRRRVKRPN